MPMLKKSIVIAICCFCAAVGNPPAGSDALVPPAPEPPPPPSAAELADEALAHSLRSHALALRFSPDSKELITAGAITKNEKPLDKRLRVWSVHTGKEIWRLPAEPCSPEGFWLSPLKDAVGKTLLMPDFKTMYTSVWSLRGFHKINIHSFHFGRDLKISNGYMGSIELSPDRKLLAVGTTCHVFFLDAKTHKILRTYVNGGQATKVFWGPHSKTLLCTWRPNEGKPQAMDVATAKQIHYPRWFYRIRGSDAFAFSPDGNYLAKAKNHTIEIWTTPTKDDAGKKLNTFTTSIDIVRVLQFSPDGKTLAVGGSSKTKVPVQFINLSQVRK
jgi:WD40 repeat protein